MVIFMAQNSSKTMAWCRLWHDMPTDPKFRVVAKRAGRPTAEVLAVFTAMLANASANEDERGTLRGWCHEDIAAALDMEPEHAEAIFKAMQGKLLEGDQLTGWERRQPKREREDNSAPRVAAHRERKQNVTPCNASADPVTPSNALEERREEKRREEKCSSARAERTDAATLPERFMDRMIEAAGDCLANPCNAQGLLTEATPVMWIENGCDFERDVLPTLRAAGVSRKGKRIHTWSYFTNMVAETRARRLAGMPAIQIPKPKSSSYTPTPRRDREPTREELDRIAMEFMN